MDEDDSDADMDALLDGGGRCVLAYVCVCCLCVCDTCSATLARKLGGRMSHRLQLSVCPYQQKSVRIPSSVGQLIPLVSFMLIALSTSLFHLLQGRLRR